MPDTTFRDLSQGVLIRTEVGPLEIQPVENLPNTDVPVAYISFDSGRHDLGINSFATHVVEVLSIRVEVVLSKKIGIRDDGQVNNVRPIEFQASDFLYDVDNLVTKENLQTAVRRENTPLASDNTVQEVVIQEWELDQRFRGGDLEVLVVTLAIEVADARQQT